MEAPEVIGYGDFNVESFAEYLGRWPDTLRDFPENLIENWVYRHWPQFRDDWMPQGALGWRYELNTFTNEQVMSIAHYENDLRSMDYWGDQLFVDRIRQSTWLATYMLEHGTTPAPILVLNAGCSVRHPRAIYEESILEPFQIVEGHMRLAYLRGMIRGHYPRLQLQHEVWVATAKN